jgi:hypothetical protein
MTLEALVQTRIPAQAGQRAASLARAEGLSVAAWLRRLILREVYPVYTEAWTGRRGHPVNQNGYAWYFLSRVQDLSETVAEFKIFLGPSYDSDRWLPMSALGAERQDWYQEPREHLFWLKGSKKPWSIKRTMEVSGQMCVILQLEDEP